MLVEVIAYHNWEYCITNWSSTSILVAMMFYFWNKNHICRHTGLCPKISQMWDLARFHRQIWWYMSGVHSHAKTHISSHRVTAGNVYFSLGFIPHCSPWFTNHDCYLDYHHGHNRQWWLIMCFCSWWSSELMHSLIHTLCLLFVHRPSSWWPMCPTCNG